MQISTFSSAPIPEIVRAPRPPTAEYPYIPTFFQQLYVDRNRDKCESFVKKVQANGIKAIFVTVDTAIVGKREGDERSKAEQEVVSSARNAVHLF